MNDFFREMISDNKTGRLSSARYISVLAARTLAICTLALTVIVCWRVEVVAAITVGLGSLAGLAGINYASQKISEKKDQGGQP